jgi:toxin ParE1/3/4
MDILWGDGAKRDFTDAIAFIRSENPAGATRVGERILATIELLREFPDLAQVSRKHRGLRQLVVAKTPYLVIYRVEATHIEIRAVVHAQQRRRK